MTDTIATVITEPGVLRRFAARVAITDDPDACHIWTGARSGGGYGQLSIDRRPVYAHRLALSWKIGRPLEPAEFVLHQCDNPPCVNPAHLRIGDQTQNMRECRDRGRADLTGLALGRKPGKTLGVYRTGAELCGTVRGYSRHLRHGESSCHECRDAINAYQRSRRQVSA